MEEGGGGRKKANKSPELYPALLHVLSLFYLGFTFIFRRCRFYLCVLKPLEERNRFSHDSTEGFCVFERRGVTATSSVETELCTIATMPFNDWIGVMTNNVFMFHV